ncbi:MAG: ParA family protein [Anaerolineales bacterium]|nr:ParA family protein [Anaerolineales bacterium]MCA9930251.1 ParA family protein [Anaerolineales bacterium]
MTIIAISGQKGGSGRSSSTYAIGTALAQNGRKILMVDCDPQSSLTAACGVAAEGESLAEVIGGAVPGRIQLAGIIYEIEPALHLAPSDIALATAELGLVSRMGRENVLRTALSTVAADYEIALLDCPPSLGLMTVNALVASHGVIVPLQPATNDVRALRLFLGTLDQVKRELNPAIELIGILPTMFDGRMIHHQDAITVMQEAGLSLFSSYISRSVKVAEAAAGGESIVTYDPDHKITAAYRDVAREIETWLRNGRG